jgi:hypothetical protein
MGSQPQPNRSTPTAGDVNARLAELGVVVTTSTPEGRRATLNREPLRIPGVSVSETVVELRNEPRSGA